MVAKKTENNSDLPAESKKAMADAAYDPLFRAIFGAGEYKKILGHEPDMAYSIDALRAQVAEVQTGNMKGVEKTLVVQANTLDAIFNNLAMRAANQNYIPAMESLLRLALKAQNQCRATLETLATIKNPPVIYARQANVTTGPQQVNNGMAAPTHARKIENEPNQLSEEPHHELLPDTRASSLASGTDSTLEAMGKKHRAKVTRR